MIARTLLVEALIGPLDPISMAGAATPWRMRLIPAFSGGLPQMAAPSIRRT